MIRKIVRIVLLVAIVGACLIAVIIGYYVYQRNAETTNFILYHPSRQYNTIWKTAENDIVFIVGDKEDENSFHAFALYDGEYIEVNLDCDYGQNAKISIPNDNTTGGNKDLCLIFGKYQVFPDCFLIEVDKNRSPSAFVGKRDTIIFQRFFINDAEEDSELKQIVSGLMGK